MKQSKKKSLFKKFLRSYVFIFAIPTIIMGIIMYNLSVVNLRTEVEESNINMLKQVNNTINMRIAELQHLAGRISFDTRLAYYNVVEDGYKTRDVVDELEKYRLNSSFIDEILLYFRGDTRIYSSQGMQSIDTLTQNVYKYSNWTKEDFINDINTVKSITVRPAEMVSINTNDRNSFLTYLCPTPQNSAYPTGTILFMIKEQMLTDLFKDILGEFVGSVYVLDNTQNILVSKNTGVSANFDDIKNILKSKRMKEISNVQLDGQNYSLMNVTSDITGWQIVSLIPSSQFMRRVTTMRNFVLTLILVVTLIGATLTWILSVNNYKPIKNLSDYVNNQWPQETKPVKRDELDIIRSTMENVFDHGKELEMQVDQQKSLVREQMLLRLLKGQIDGKDELDRLKICSGITLNGAGYAVMVLALPNSTPMDEYLKEKVFRSLEHYSCQLGDAFSVQMSYNSDELSSDVASLLLVIHRVEDFGSLKSAAETILASVHAQSGFVPVIGVGKIYREILQVKYSFIEAFSAIESKTRNDDSNITMYEDIALSQEQGLQYPVKDQLRFIQSIKQGSVSVAEEALNCLIKELNSGTIPKYFVKCISYDVINAVIKIINELCTDQFNDDIRKLTEYKSLNELQSSLAQLVDKLCSYIEASKESKNVGLITQILEYIQNNYRSYNVSLEIVADEFSISPYYLSRFFKEQTGENFSDYLTTLRINEMKNQLAHTSKPIKNIIEEVGYRDASNFARRFKAIEGLTPGEYRKLYYK